MKIVVLDGATLNSGDLSWEPLKKLGEIEIYERTFPNETVERCKDAEIVITNKVKFPKEIIDKLPKLKYIGVVATGYNVIDIDATNKRGIVVTNAPSYSTMSVAQMVFSFLFHITNHVADYDKQNKEGKWVASKDFTYRNEPIIELSGKTFGIYGMGNIGNVVAQIALTLGMNVIAKTSKDMSQLPNGVKPVTFEELLQQSDVLSLHCPLTPETTQLINKETLSKVKPTAIIINTARGPIINENDVAQALKENHLGAFCADVLSVEPPTQDNPLLSAPRCYTTPHIAWASFEARQRLMGIITENVRQFINGKPVNIVRS